jgi:glutathione synthase/RimK-type ligase-like ATP-grasp enzyme
MATADNGNACGLPFPLLFTEPEPELPNRSPSFDLTEKVAQICGPARPTGMRDKILVLRSIGMRDIQAEEIVTELGRRGLPVYFFHTDEFLRACRLSIRLGQSGSSLGILEMPSGTLALEEVKSVWFRGPGVAVGDPPRLQGDPADFVRRETDAALAGLLGVMNQAFWVNPPQAVQAAEDKLAQLKLAQSLGFLIPRTLITNDPQQARSFYDSCRGEMIVKTFRRLAGHTDGRERLILTNRILPRHLDQIDLVGQVPCFFQEYVPKEVELRITVVGRRIFAAEIHSQQSVCSRDDYRRYDFANTHYGRCSLPAELESLCLRLLGHYGLVFGAIDMIRRPDGACVFLEINANAQFLWIQDLTGLPILPALADMLVRGSADDARKDEP